MLKTVKVLDAGIRIIDLEAGCIYLKKLLPATVIGKPVKLYRKSIALISINPYFSGTNICYAATA